jgi:hypothetical protein
LLPALLAIGSHSVSHKANDCPVPVPSSYSILFIVITMRTRSARLPKASGVYDQLSIEGRAR